MHLCVAMITLNGQLSISFLCPCRVAVVSKRFEGKTDLTDPWYEAKYNFRKVDPCLIERWSAVAHMEELHLPAPNEFIPTNFDIVPREENSPCVPTLIQVRECGTQVSNYSGL